MGKFFRIAALAVGGLLSPEGSMHAQQLPEKATIEKKADDTLARLKREYDAKVKRVLGSTTLTDKKGRDDLIASYTKEYNLDVLEYVANSSFSKVENIYQSLEGVKDDELKKRTIELELALNFLRAETNLLKLSNAISASHESARIANEAGSETTNKLGKLRQMKIDLTNRGADLDESRSIRAPKFIELK